MLIVDDNAINRRVAELLVTQAEAAAPARRGARPIVVAVSAHTDDQNRQTCADVGMAAFIGKPVRYETLIEVLVPLVKNRPQRAA